jgi:GT2 family glycosyltransferase
MHATPEVSVIIVSYNTRELLRECIESILCGQGNGITVEVIVVDNASADGSAPMVAERFPQARLIANPDNRGFGAACNQGLEIARGRYALILNADIRAQHGALQRLVGFMDAHPDAAICGGQLALPRRAHPALLRPRTHAVVGLLRAKHAGETVPAHAPVWGLLAHPLGLPRDD